MAQSLAGVRPPELQARAFVRAFDIGYPSTGQKILNVMSSVAQRVVSGLVTIATGILLAHMLIVKGVALAMAGFVSLRATPVYVARANVFFSVSISGSTISLSRNGGSVTARPAPNSSNTPAITGSSTANTSSWVTKLISKSSW